MSHRLERLNGTTKKTERWAGPWPWWLPIDDFPHSNKPKIGGRDGGEYGGEVRRAGGAGEAHFHCFGGIGS